MLNKLFLLLIFLILSCDGRKLTCVERQSRATRLCSYDEITFIDNWNIIVNKINTFNVNDFKKNFLSHFIRGDFKKPNIVLLGEIHDQVDGIILNWSYINYLAQLGNIQLLKEGADFDPNHKKDNINLELIFSLIDIVQSQQLVKEGLPYEPKVWDKEKAARLTKTLDHFFSSINNLQMPTHLKRKNIHFSHWDKSGEKIDYKGMVARNTSMVNAISQTSQKKPKDIIVIIAGMTHLPLGEYLNLTHLIKALDGHMPPNFNSYYVEAHRLRTKYLNEKGSLEYYEEWLASSQVIYNFLSHQSGAVVQAIPQKSFEHWRSLVH